MRIETLVVLALSLFAGGCAAPAAPHIYAQQLTHHDAPTFPREILAAATPTAWIHFEISPWTGAALGVERVEGLEAVDASCAVGTIARADMSSLAPPRVSSGYLVLQKRLDFAAGASATLTCEIPSAAVGQRSVAWDAAETYSGRTVLQARVRDISRDRDKAQISLEVAFDLRFERPGGDPQPVFTETFTRVIDFDGPRVGLIIVRPPGVAPWAIFFGAWPMAGEPPVQIFMSTDRK